MTETVNILVPIFISLFHTSVLFNKDSVHGVKSCLVSCYTVKFSSGNVNVYVEHLVNQYLLKL